MIKVKFVCFGGAMEYPCYEDEAGKLYFDGGYGRSCSLQLYNGAYRNECGEICGEPYSRVTDEVLCAEPFRKNQKEADYMLLDRLKSDCEYFLGYGNRCSKNLYYKDVDTHCNEMMRLYDSFSDAEKPEWITRAQIEECRIKMMAA